ncbi:hypothetical protein M1N55_02785 [Dehalococcoidia bacterium]|nr:hypothetical protein [Dehalococcoidia bacterium]
MTITNENKRSQGLTHQGILWNKHFIRQYEERRHTVHELLIEEGNNEHQYNNSETKRIHHIIDLTIDDGRNYAKITTRGNGTGMDIDQLHKGYFDLGRSPEISEKFKDGRGLLGDGAKIGCAKGRKLVRSMRNGKAYEAEFDPNSNVSGKVEIETPKQLDAYEKTQLEKRLGSKSGTEVIQYILNQHQFALNEVISLLQLDIRYKHVLDDAEVTMEILEDGKKKKQLTLVHNNSVRLKKDSIVKTDLKPAQTGISFNKDLNKYEQENGLNVSGSDFKLVLGEIEGSTPGDDSIHNDPMTRKSGVVLKSENGECYDNTYGFPKPFFSSPENVEFVNMIAGTLTAPDDLIRALLRSCPAGSDFLKINRRGMADSNKNLIVRNLQSLIGNKIKAYVEKLKKQHLHKQKTDPHASQNASMIAADFAKYRNQAGDVVINKPVPRVKPVGDMEFRPPKIKIEKNTNGFSTLLIRKELDTSKATLSFQSSDNSISEVNSRINIPGTNLGTQRNTLVYKDHPNFPDFGKTTVKIDAKNVGNAAIEATLTLPDGRYRKETLDVEVINQTLAKDIGDNEIKFLTRKSKLYANTAKEIKLGIGVELYGKIDLADIKFQMKNVHPAEDSNINLDFSSIKSSLDQDLGPYGAYVATIKITANGGFSKGTLEAVIATNTVEETASCGLYLHRGILVPEVKIYDKAAATRWDPKSEEAKFLKRTHISVRLGDDMENKPDLIEIFSTHKNYKKTVAFDEDDHIDYSANESFCHQFGRDFAYAYAQELHHRQMENDDKYKDQSPPQANKSLTDWYNKVLGTVERFIDQYFDKPNL